MSTSTSTDNVLEYEYSSCCRVQKNVLEYEYEYYHYEYMYFDLVFR